MVLEKQAPIEEKPLEQRDVETPAPGPGQVRIRLEACGVCHTDLHIVEGDLKLHKTPIIPGHEVIGTIESTGRGANRFEPGDRVGSAWLHRVPEDCEYIERGQENLCEDAAFTGWDADGGFAEMMLAPEDFIYPIPEIFSSVQAAPLMCAGVIGYRSLKLAGAENADRLGLYGFGASAHIAIQVARHWGCDVYVFTRSEEHKRHAQQLGAVWVGEAQDDPLERMNSSVIYAPAGWIVPEALRVLDVGGTVALAGIHMSPIPEMDYDLIYGERVLRSVANATRDDALELLQIAAEIPVQTETTTFKLQEANEALRQMKESEINGAAVLDIAGST